MKLLTVLTASALLAAPLAHTKTDEQVMQQIRADSAQSSALVVKSICAHNPKPSVCYPIARKMVEALRKDERLLNEAEENYRFLKQSGAPDGSDLTHLYQ